MSEEKTSITYEDRTAYQDGIRVGIQKGRAFERSEILRMLEGEKTKLAASLGLKGINMGIQVTTLEVMIEKIKERNQ
jgi:hypothetical protein